MCACQTSDPAVTKKKHFEWNDKAEKAFLALKSAMISNHSWFQTPVLALPNFQELFTIETDACGAGIGAVLIQKEQPVAFLSKALGDKHKQLSIYEKEFLALLMTVEKWRQYLQEQEFVIRTDRRRSDGWLDGCTSQSAGAAPISS